MSRNAKLAVLLAVLVAIGVAAWQIGRGSGSGVASLTPVPGATGFEPTDRVGSPVLRSSKADGLDVAFGYKVGATCCDYALSLAFAPGATDGTATLTARRNGKASTERLAAVRRWDEPRRSYAVALLQPSAARASAPALCIKAVVGPSLDKFDLADATLCAAQRDTAGACHPETLACGLIRAP